MKRMIAVGLVLLQLTALTACGSGSNEVDPGLVITRPTESAAATDEGSEPTQAQTQTEEPTPEQTVTEKPNNTVFSLTWQGVTIVPGEIFDASALPEPESVYQVPSCAVEGTDNVYNYGEFEVTAFQDADGERVYCIYFIDPNLKTAEGLATGDSVEDALALYGTDYTQQEDAYVYSRGSTLLRLIARDGIVISIECLLDTAA